MRTCRVRQANRAIVGGWIVAVLVLGCGQQGTPVGPELAPRPGVPFVVSGDMPAPTESLVPRALYFGNPEKTQARLSPDGEWLSFLAPHEGVMNVWVAPTAEPTAVRPVTQDQGRGIRVHMWAYTSQHLLYLQDRGGDENWHLHVVDMTTLEDRDLTPMDGVSARVAHLSPSKPLEIAVGLNDRDPQVHDIHRIHLDTGERRLEIENDGFMDLVLDDKYEVRIAVKALEDGGATWLQTSDDGWQPFLQLPMEDTLTSKPLAISEDRATLTMLDSRGRDTAALVSVELATKATTVLAEVDGVDIDEVILHPQTHAPLAWSATAERKRWEAADPDVRDDLNALGAQLDGELSVVSVTSDLSRWMVASSKPDAALAYYLYDRETKTTSLLFSSRPALDEVPLVGMRSATIEARDGLPLVVYASQPEREGPHPTVLLVHGGPWARDRWGYDPLHQWLASRGYAALSVNFRGSTGLGKRFLNAANGQWAAAMHDDLLDAVDWAVEEGIAQPDKVCIMGASYGGYAALVGLTFTPERFTCAVDVVGPSNLVTLLESIPPYWKPMFELLAARVGDPRTAQGAAFLKERSPLHRVDEIRRPLLIGQGANDPRVKQSESDQIVEAMNDRGIPVTYVLFPDEGHGFAKPENRLAFWAVAEAFLARHLGGVYQAAGTELDASSAVITQGREEIPGL